MNEKEKMSVKASELIPIFWQGDISLSIFKPSNEVVSKFEEDKNSAVTN